MTVTSLQRALASLRAPGPRRGAVRPVQRAGERTPGAAEREGEPLHTPKNAVMAPAGKGANLLELFAVADTAAVWSGEDDERAVQSRQERADVLACLHRPADALHLCLQAVLAEKIEKKYRTSPVHLARGKADTYTQLGG